MRKHRYGRTIYLVFVVLVSTSAAFYELAFHSQKGNPFTLLSPLPIVFSVGRGKKTKEVITRLVYNENGTEKTLSFNRDFYLSLDGPHHYRLLFMLKLKRPQFITQSDFPIFLSKTFCDSRIKPFRNRKLDYIKFIIKDDYDYYVNDLMVTCNK